MMKWVTSHTISSYTQSSRTWQLPLYSTISTLCRPNKHITAKSSRCNKLYRPADNLSVQTISALWLPYQCCRHLHRSSHRLHDLCTLAIARNRLKLISLNWLKLISILAISSTQIITSYPSNSTNTSGMSMSSHRNYSIYSTSMSSQSRSWSGRGRRLLINRLKPWRSWWVQRPWRIRLRSN